MPLVWNLIEVPAVAGFEVLPAITGSPVDLLPGGPVRIGFQYTGLDGAQIGLDAVILDVPSDVPWLSENPTSGTVAPGSSQVVTVTFDSTGLALGEYLASLDIYSNDPDESLITLPVTLTVAYQIYLPITFK